MPCCKSTECHTPPRALKKLTWLKRGAQLLVWGSAQWVNMKMEELVEDRLGDISKLGVNVG